MGNKPFDRYITHVGLRPSSSDINLPQSYADLSLRETTKALIAPRTAVTTCSTSSLHEARFWGEGFKVVPTLIESMSVRVKAGFGFADVLDKETDIDSILGLNDTSATKPVVLYQIQQLAIEPVLAPASKRIDIIEVRPEYFFTNERQQDIFNPATGTFQKEPKNKTFSWALDSRIGTVSSGTDSTAPLSIKKGNIQSIATPDFIPAVTPGYTKIAEIVAVTGLDITADRIRDTRRIAGKGGQVIVSGRCNLKNAVLPVVPPIAQFAEILEVNAPPGIDVRVTTRSATERRYTITIAGKFQKAHAIVNLVGTYFEDQNNLSFIIIQWDPAPEEPDALEIKVRNEWKPRIEKIEIGRIDTISSSVTDGVLWDLLQTPDRTEPPITISDRQHVVAITFVIEKKTVQLDFFGTSSPAIDAMVDFIAVLD